MRPAHPGKEGAVFRLIPENRSFSRNGRLLIAACGFVVTLVLGAVALYSPAFVAHLDGRFFDGLLADEPPPAGYDGPVVVALDDDSLARFGRWPWPRALVARLLTLIADQHPASVGIDALFPEPELPLDRQGLPATTGRPSPGDLALARALAGGPFVLGFELTFPPAPPAARNERLLKPLSIVVERKPGAPEPRGLLWQATGVVSSLPEFARCAAGSGFLNAATEQDGILRRMPQLLAMDGNVYPSLALATVGLAAHAEPAHLAALRPGELILEFGGRRVPLDEKGRLLLRYRGWHGQNKPVSAAALLEGRVPRDALKGRVVFVGATATGMGEAVATPVQTLLSGVQVHAIAAENLLRGDFARPAPWHYRLPATLALGLVATVVCVSLPVAGGASLLGIAAGAAWLGSVWLFRTTGLFLPPVVPVLGAVATFILLTLIRSFLAEKRSLRQAEELAATRDFIMTSLASLADIRDTETGAHIMRTQRYMRSLCQELARHPRFKPLLDEGTIELIAKLAPLHDIGKVGLPDHLLRKTTGFTAEEYEEVKKHALYGRDAIANAETRAGANNDELLRYAKDLAYSHHERWDGTGYPEGLRGDQIPWAGRLMAVADAYDAMVSRRIYKEPIPHDEAVRIIVKGKGTLFDPDVVDAFLRVESQWRQVSIELADSD